MDRRGFIVAVCGALACAEALPAGAQRAQRSLRIATLDEGSAQGRDYGWGVFYARLRELGYEEGESLIVERYWADGNEKRLAALAAGIAARRPHIIVTGGTPAALAAKRATATIPIVFCGVADPIGTGLVQSLSRPEANLTGVTNINLEIVGKWLGLTLELVPKAKSIAFLTDARNPASRRLFADLQKSAEAAGIKVRLLDGNGRETVASALTTLERERPDALITSAAGALLSRRRQITEAARRLRLPALYGNDTYVEAGGLMSYSAASVPQWRRAAELVHEIVHGSKKPSEIPVEQSSVFRFVLNLGAARAIGLAIPQSLLLRADRVIE